MKTKTKSSDFSLDGELLNLFKEVFSDDETSYQIAVQDAKRAFSFIREHESNTYDFNDNFY